ncbi:MAG: GNAT family N-acetyltransferase [Paracoccaceae bacterium]|nr:GNAT family N-acetyltransferase [Paracoccaceae bacterium]MDG1739083.1 GNAT family N-acetyltransferase [Paracoccaceae bacterium]MDG2260526.1 GNAT family N-acetyltransferase [Paracoccaceae bacterium]
MTLKSLGLATDIMVLGDRSYLEEREDRYVLRTPEEPDFWFGNMIIYREDVIEPAKQIETFKAEFPDAKHTTIGWDVPNMEGGDRLAYFSNLGFKTDQCDVLVLSGTLAPAGSTSNFTIRPLSTDEDWEKATDLQGIIGVETGNNADGYYDYIKTRMIACRRLTEEGRGVWLGAFSGDELAGDLGIYANKDIARFQAVETRPSYRRQGVCAALVTAGVQWAQSRFPNTKTVIVADEDSAAGRIYRRCGFEMKEQLLAVYRGPENAES